MQKLDPESWKLIATGEEGDHITWLDGFEAIENARFYLMQLEGDAYAAIDWSELLDGLPDLERIDELADPPLYRAREFEELGGFMVLIEEPIDDMPGRSFNQLEIYIEPDRATELVRQFRILGERLEPIIDKL